MVRGFGKLLSKGWKPLRTIVLASWDAEEYGLIGSTEWTEDFGDWLKVNSVSSYDTPKENELTTDAVYLNVDVAVAGPNFKCAASPVSPHLPTLTALVTDE
jgi:N-acetylated-alpha-linked acidic dipeptidase